MTRLAKAIMIAAALLGSTPGAIAQVVSPLARVAGAPDFTGVDSLEQARALAESGELEAVLLFPEEVGGGNEPHNVVYLPPEAAAAKRQVDETIVRMVEEGLLNQLTVSPVYRGNSFVPFQIEIEAWHVKREGRLNNMINVW